MFTPEELKARREARKAARNLAKENARMESEKNQRPVKSLTISIEWCKSYMWGNNPHTQVDVYYYPQKSGNNFERRDGFTCSGCGYDKESTVIADIFNTFLRYKLWGKVKKVHTSWNDKGTKKIHTTPYGISFYVNKETGADHRSYSGGVGTSCYTGDSGVAAAIGGKFEHIASGKKLDVYKYTDNA
jgi:hypothetical protein